MTPWLLALALGFLGQNQAPERHEFPLEPGMYWSYEETLSGQNRGRRSFSGAE